MLYRCNNGVWQSPAATYTTGDRQLSLGDSDGYFDGFGLFALGAPPSRNADLIDLVLNGATVTPDLTLFAPAVFEYTTTVPAMSSP